jgi:imidazolonepropionase-like amidohydrolase
MNNKIVLKNVNIVDTADGNVLKSVDIVIDKNEILEISETGHIGDTGAKHIDCTGKYALPGLFECHAHLTVLTNQSDEIKKEILNECRVSETNGDLDKLVLREFVRRGITQIRDLGGPINVMKNMADNISQKKYIGPDIFYAGPMLQKSAPADQGSNERWPGFCVVIDSKREVEDIMRALAHNGVGLVKTFRDLEPDIFKYLLKEAAKYYLPVTYDPGPTFFQTVPIDKAIDMGIKCIEHGKSPWQAVLTDELNTELDSLKDADPQKKAAFTEKVLLMGVESVSHPKLDTLIDKMKTNNVSFCPTLHVFKDYIERTDVYNENEEEQVKLKKTFTILLEMSRFFTTKLINGGVKILIGQDGWNPVFTFNEIKLLSDSGLSNTDIIKGATIYPSEWLHLSDNYGSIEPDKKANILILNQNPLEAIGNIEDTYAVIKDDKIYTTTKNKEI